MSKIDDARSPKPPRSGRTGKFAQSEKPIKKDDRCPNKSDLSAALEKLRNAESVAEVTSSKKQLLDIIRKMKSLKDECA